MQVRVQYNTLEERENILSEYSDYILVGEDRLFEGNFLIFSDTPIEKEIVYMNMPKSKITAIEDSLESQNNDNLILMDALATIYEELLARGVL